MRRTQSPGSDHRLDAVSHPCLVLPWQRMSKLSRNLLVTHGRTDAQVYLIAAVIENSHYGCRRGCVLSVVNSSKPSMTCRFWMSALQQRIDGIVRLVSVAWVCGQL